MRHVSAREKNLINNKTFSAKKDSSKSLTPPPSFVVEDAMVEMEKQIFEYYIASSV